LDSSQPGFIASGTWNYWEPGGYGDSLFWHEEGTGFDTARWTFTVTPGRYRVSATYPGWGPHAAEAGYTIYDGAAQAGTATVDQRRLPNDLLDQAEEWEDLGVFLITGDTLAVALLQTDTGDAIADAIRIERVGDSDDVIPTVQIVDDRQLGFNSSGVWNDWPEGGYHDALLWRPDGAGNDSATWSFLVEPGEFRVSATWPGWAPHATAAPYVVIDGTTAVGNVERNQTLLPDDLIELGVRWEDLGVFAITSNSLVVRLNQTASGDAIADAVRIERIGDLPGESLATTDDAQALLEAPWSDLNNLDLHYLASLLSAGIASDSPGDEEAVDLLFASGII
jgi:hypothetical protein